MSSKKKADKPPFELILDLVRKFLRRIKFDLIRRLVILILCIVVGSKVVFWTLSQKQPQNALANTGGAMDGVVGVIFGTICLALLKDILDKYYNKEAAKDMLDDLNKFSKSDEASKYKKFEERFYDVVRLVFK